MDVQDESLVLFSRTGAAMQSPRTPTPAPSRDRRAEKVRLFRQLYLSGRLNEVLIPEDADVSALVDAVFADRRRAY